jgi:3-oxoacyl-[acyl-carrier-protein] synthase-1
LSAPSACAAIRAGVTNPALTYFLDLTGEWINAHQVTLERPWQGRAKLVKMATMAIAESLTDIPRIEWAKIPLLLCTAETDRPGRPDGFDHQLFSEIQLELGIQFSEHSLVIPQGRVGFGTALMQARRFVFESDIPLVLIAATDSLLDSRTLRALDRANRLLTKENSDGFIPGEGAGTVLVGQQGNARHLQCIGLGFASESAQIGSNQPLRGEGMAQAIKGALDDAQCRLHEVDLRISDLSGEQYYFKEAALALARILRVRKEKFDIWHPAECVGEVGAVAGLTIAAVADAAFKKGYACGSRVLCHLASDSGERAAAIFSYGAA